MILRTPHKIQERDLPPVPPTFKTKLLDSYVNGARAHIFTKKIKRYWVSETGERVNMIYGDGNAIEITNGKKCYYLLTEGIDYDTKEKLLTVVPKTFKVSEEKKLSQLGVKNEDTWLKFIILPDCEFTLQDPPKTSEERLKLGIPRAYLYIFKNYFGSNPNKFDESVYIYPTNQTEAQAMLRLYFSNKQIETKESRISLSWEFANPDKKNPLIKDKVPLISKIRTPTPEEFQFHMSDLFFHPFHSTRAFFKGLSELIRFLKSYENPKVEKDD